jgi:flagellar protein FliO/FliZ
VRGVPLLSHALLAAAFVPAAAFGAEGNGSGFSLLASLIQMVAALAVVVGLILVFYYAANRWLRTAPGGIGAARYIRLIETRYLAPKKSLVLVEVGGEYLLLASCGESLNFIKQVNMLEDIEVLEIPGEEGLGGAFRDRLQEFMRKLPKSGARPDSPRSSQEAGR